MRLPHRPEPLEPPEDDEYEQPRRVWPTVVVVVVAVVFIGTATIAGVRSLQFGHAAAQAAAAQRNPMAGRPIVQVLADPALLGDPSSRWWARLASREPVELRVDSVSDGRYVGTGDGTFGAAANQVVGDARMVILVGDSGDQDASSVEIAGGATRALARARLNAPACALMVVGPVGGDANVLRVRAALRASARIAGATWVDSDEVERAGAAQPPVSSSAVARTRLVEGIEQLIETALDAP